MTDAITAISQSMNADLAQLRTVGQNISNAGTHGFRANSVVPAVDNLSGSGIPNPENMRTYVSTESGALQSTGRSLDFAISGDGYFAVSTPDGVRYTRNGAFSLDAEGRLLAASGHPVLGEGGEIRLKNASVSVTLDGLIYTDGEQVDAFVLASPGKEQSIEVADGGLYSFKAAGDDTASRIHQGMLEASNVNVTSEMVRMIELSRHIESVQRAMLSYDRMLDTGINQIGSKR